MKKLSLIASCLVLSSSLMANGMEKSMKKPMMVMPLAPVHGTSGMVFPKDTFITAIKSIFMEKDQAYNGDEKVTDMTRRDMKVWRHNLIFRYGLGSGFDLRFLVPIFQKDLTMYNPKARSGGDFSNSGIGDMRVFLRYELTSQKKGAWLSSAVDFGLELPTGDTEDDFFLQNGMKLPNHNPLGMQLGSGSVNPILGLSATKIMHRHRIDTSAQYFFNQEGDDNFQKGDQLNYAFGYAFMLHPKFMPNIEFNGKYYGKNKLDGVTLDNTGGHEVFITPGFSSHITKNLKLLAGYSFPIYRDMNDGALGTKGIVTTKLMYRW